jgi:hypothetical protein
MKFIGLLALIFFLQTYFYFFPVPDHESPEYFAWKSQHEAQARYQATMEEIFLSPDFHFRALELIEVGPGAAYHSSWGHLLLRFVGSGKSSDEDLTLSFLADFNDFPVNRYKASFGGYTVLPKLDYLKSYHQEYSLNENRYMRGYALNTSEYQNRKLNSVLKSWIKDKSLPGTYTFILNNCVGVMNKLFVESEILTGEILDGRRRYPEDIPSILLKKGIISLEDFNKYAKK